MCVTNIVADDEHSDIIDRGDPTCSALAQLTLRERAASDSDIKSPNRSECAAPPSDDHLAQARRAALLEAWKREFGNIPAGIVTPESSCARDEAPSEPFVNTGRQPLQEVHENVDRLRHATGESSSRGEADAGAINFLCGAAAAPEEVSYRNWGFGAPAPNAGHRLANLSLIHI